MLTLFYLALPLLLFYHKNNKEPLIHGVSRKNKVVMFHSWGRRLIPDSLAPEVQAV